MSIMKKSSLLFILMLVLLLINGCSRTITEIKVVEIENAKTVEVTIKFAGGSLKINGEEDKLLRANFSYNSKSLKPVVEYKVSQEKGQLTIKHDEDSISGVHIFKKSDWNLCLNNDIPMDLNISFGAGKNDLNLGSLNLGKIDISVGAGETRISLVGDWKRDLRANINGGVGKITLILPSNVGVYIEATKGIGDINNEGLVKNGNVYTNEVFGKSDIYMYIIVKTGIGEINLKLDE
ncbi:MAG: hypothetical protein KAX49_16730 [Halanaerobiales bacterium]|nr:hypothetical protein [Halanaerobiales bacterium]